MKMTKQSRGKKLAGLLLLLLVFASLTGCGKQPAAGGDLPQEEEVPQEQETQEPAPEGFSTANKGISVAEGKAGTADLDGDGISEEITYVLQDDVEHPVKSLTIGGIEWIDTLENDFSIYFITPLDHFYITDLNEEDSYQEIALMDMGPSDDPTTMFFRYDGEKLSYLGATADLIENDSYALDGKGKIQALGRLSVLQTWLAPFTWEDVNGTITFVEEDWYTPCYYPEMEIPVVTIISPLTVYEQPEVTSNSTVLLPGPVKVEFLATDNKEWVKLQRGEEESGWMHLTEFNMVDTGDTAVDAQEIFQGLAMFD